MHTVEGRKAILLISTGLDTFSHATIDQVVTAAQRSGTPVYCVGLAGLVERSIIGSTGPIAKISWAQARERLKTLAEARAVERTCGTRISMCLQCTTT